jgi:hypothetical protein
MALMTDEELKQIVKEINGQEENNRRILMKRRHDIFKDGGRKFLIEQITREFGKEALDEMRLAPVNLLKKIVSKRSRVYKKAPTRKTTNPKDQALVDYYVEELDLNVLMQKVNRYYNLFSNCTIYTRPGPDGLESVVVPPYLYSVKANSLNQSKIDAFVYSAFVRGDSMTPLEGVPPASGQENFSLQKGFKSSGDKIASNEIDTDQEANQHIYWSDVEHFTLDKDGNKLLLNPKMGTEQWLNPIMRKPVVNVTKDRDNESWATQGEDIIDLTMAIQLGWSDLLTISKHQGFSLLTVVSEEEPKKINVGINRAVWLRAKPDGVTPSISYVQAQSPLDQYKNLLMDLLGLLLTTNEMDPNSIGGSGSTQSFTSGFHALIAMSDNLEAIESDKPAMMAAELDQWDVIQKWHNYLYDVGALDEDAKVLGKFSEEFEIQIIYADAKPLQSEQEQVALIKDLRAEGLITRADALKKLNPEMTDDQVIEKLKQIDAESEGQLQQAMSAMPKELPEENNQKQNEVASMMGENGEEG